MDNVGLEVERKGLKASEKSDHNVRKAYDNSHKPREDIKDAAKEAKHKGKEVGRGVNAAPHRVHLLASLSRGVQHTASNKPREDIKECLQMLPRLSSMDGNRTRRMAGT